MLPLHPAIVHFPVALLLVSVLLDAVGVLWRRAAWTHAGFLALVGGSAGAGLAALTGPAEDARNAAAQSALLTHELLALGTLLVCLALVGLRIGNVDGLRGPGVWGYLALSAVLVALVVATGYVGGQLTYTHGVGVARLQDPANAATEPERGGQVGEMWAKVSGLGLLLVVAGYAISLLGAPRRRGGDVRASGTRWTLNAKRNAAATVPTEEVTQ